MKALKDGHRNITFLNGLWNTIEVQKFTDASLPQYMANIPLELYMSIELFILFVFVYYQCKLPSRLAYDAMKNRYRILYIQ